MKINGGKKSIEWDAIKWKWGGKEEERKENKREKSTV
jgi:hypothetical protein